MTDKHEIWPMLLACLGSAGSRLASRCCEPEADLVPPILECCPLQASHFSAGHAFCGEVVWQWGFYILLFDPKEQ